jgi:predicted GTPase
VGKSTEALQIVGASKKINQWMLVAIAMDAQNKVMKEDWISSHNQVNTKPSTHVPFNKWIKILDEHSILVLGEKFFEKRMSLFDAMPACWVNLSVEDHHAVMLIIKGAYE